MVDYRYYRGMQHILIDARELHTTSGRYVERLLHYLQQLDNKHRYSVLLNPSDFETWQPTNQAFTKVRCTHKEFTFAEQLGLLRLVQGLAPDLVHFTFPQQPILYGGDVITTIHDLTTLRFTNPAKNRLVFSFKQAVYGQVIHRAARKSKCVITDTQFVKDDLLEFGHGKLKAENIVPIHLAADAIPQQAKPLKSLEGSQFIMYVGRPLPHKNLNRLIEAFVELKRQHPDLLLVLAGKKDSNYLRIESEVSRHTIKNVVFTDRVSEGQLRWLYENCAAYVFPSLSEGFGFPGLEAMVHGAPVVSSNATCLPEVYGKAAHYFDPLDVPAMSAAISDVLTHTSLRNRLIENGKQQAAQYSWQRTAQQTLDVYNRFLNS